VRAIEAMRGRLGFHQIAARGENDDGEGDSFH
jgi:hypothetical protein